MADKATMPDTSIDSVLQEQRKFECPDHFRQGAHIKSADEYERIYRESVEQPEKFWGRIASELHWFKKWDKVLEWSHPRAKWFSGGLEKPFPYFLCSPLATPPQHPKPPQ